MISQFITRVNTNLIPMRQYGVIVDAVSIESRYRAMRERIGKQALDAYIAEGKRRYAAKKPK